MLNNLIDWIIEHGGLYALLFIIFAETGLLLGFFLPGDSLLFAAGIYSSKGERFPKIIFSGVVLISYSTALHNCTALHCTALPKLLHYTIY